MCYAWRSTVCLLILFFISGCSSESDRSNSDSGPLGVSLSENLKTEEPATDDSTPETEDPEPVPVENGNAEEAPGASSVTTGKVEKNGDALTLTLNQSEEDMNFIGMGVSVSLSDDGELKLNNWNSKKEFEAPELETGYFILSMGREDFQYLTKAKFTELPKDGAVLMKLETGFEELRMPTPIVIVRPKGVTDEFLNRFEGIVKLNDPKREDWSGVSAVEMAKLKAQMTQSRNNLKQLGLAFHNYHDVHGCLPPGIIYGPDGKPWHSWRTLILPYLEAQNIYDSYDFMQPWDSDANRQWSSMSVPVFSDPLRGENPENYTHYVAAIGTNGVLNDVEFDGTAEGFEKALAEGVKFGDITDGTSATLLISTVSSVQKIVWTEPRDVYTNNGIPELNAKDGFQTIELNGMERLPVLMCDGSVRILEDSELDTEGLKEWITPAGGELIESTHKESVTHLTITADGENSSAVLKRVFE